MPEVMIKTAEKEAPVLFTPGPAGTEDNVKRAQVVPDISPRSPEFEELMAETRMRLVRIAADPAGTEAILLSGSGMAAVEAMLGAAGRGGRHILVIDNGVYGKRMAEICELTDIRHTVFRSSPWKPVDIAALEKAIVQAPGPVDYIAVVHHETTTGLLNDLAPLSELASRHGIRLLVDAMSSFGALTLDMDADPIAYVAASANKNLGGMPGASFVLARIDEIEHAEKWRPRSFYLDLCAEYRAVRESRQARFTMPVQTLYALDQALDNFEREGRKNRLSRFRKSWKMLLDGMSRLGFEPLVDPGDQAGLLLAVRPPSGEAFSFERLQAFFYQHRITIYPGKLEGTEYLRLACIGTIEPQDAERFLSLLGQYCATATTETGR